MSGSYLKHISGMKGLGALIVLIHHFFYVFYPLFVPEEAGTAPVEHVPVANLLVNGNFAVCLFILLSGFLVARSADSYREAGDYGFAIVKRYIRLMIPLAVAGILSYLLCVLHLYRIHGVSEALANDLTMDYFKVIRIYHLPLSVLFAPFGYSVLVGPFWMMKYILYGSFLVMAVSLATRKLKDGMQIALILFVMLLYVFLDVYFACMLAGMLLYKLGDRIRKLLKDVRMVAALVFLGAACWLTVAQKGVMEYDMYKNSLAAFLFVTAVLLSERLVKGFGCRIMDRLGQLSLGIYIFHWPVLCSLSCWMYLAWPFENRWMALSVIFIVTLAVVMALASLYNRWIEPWAISWQNRLAQYFR